MTRALIDTNIVIDALNGVPEAFNEILNYRDTAISIVTWIELMAGVCPNEFERIQGFLSRFPIHVRPLNWPIATRAALTRGTFLRMRPKRNLKLPDAIILATALSDDRLLVTRNGADFVGVDARIPYQLTNGIVSDIKPFD